MSTAAARKVTAQVLAVLALAGAGCSQSTPEPSPVPRAPSTTAPASTPPRIPPEAHATGEALAAAAQLCPKPPDRRPAGPGDPTPPELKRIEGFVEQARGLDFSAPVNMQAVTPARMRNLVAEQVSDPAADAYLDRRGRAWETMGAIPPGSDLARGFRDFATSQVIGFYDPQREVLVFIGERLDGFDKFTLAHELVHALEDQHFNLDRLLALDGACRDEAGLAARALAEGSATAYSLDVVLDSFTADELAQLGKAALTLDVEVPTSVPPFLTKLEEWPYLGGMAFIGALRDKGGDALVDFAFEHLPASTEQVMHPDSYPDDEPQVLDVPDASGPPGWKTIDVGEVGEEWLRAYLEVRGSSDAEDAAAGWDGGIYRAWSSPDGHSTAVLLETVWDTPEDAQQFAAAMRTATRGLDASVQADADRVSVGFGSTPEALAALPAA